MKPQTLTLDGFQWAENGNFLDDPPPANVLASFEYCSLNPKRFLGKKSRLMAKQLRVLTHLRIILEAVVHFGEFWGIDRFWDRLHDCLHFRAFPNSDAYRDIVTKCCAAREAYRRDYQNRHGSIPQLDDAPSVITSLVDQVIHFSTVPTKIHSSEFLIVTAWMARAASWSAKLDSIHRLIGPHCEAAEASIKHGTKRDKKKSQKEIEAQLQKANDAFRPRMDSAITAIVHSPLGDQELSVEGNETSSRTNLAASGSKPTIGHGNNFTQAPGTNASKNGGPPHKEQANAKGHQPDTIQPPTDVSAQRSHPGIMSSDLFHVASSSKAMITHGDAMENPSDLEIDDDGKIGHGRSVKNNGSSAETGGRQLGSKFPGQYVRPGILPASLYYGKTDQIKAETGATQSTKPTRDSEVINLISEDEEDGEDEEDSSNNMVMVNREKRPIHKRKASSPVDEASTKRRAVDASRSSPQNPTQNPFQNPVNIRPAPSGLLSAELPIGEKLKTSVLQVAPSTVKSAAGGSTSYVSRDDKGQATNQMRGHFSNDTNLAALLGTDGTPTNQMTQTSSRKPEQNSREIVTQSSTAETTCVHPSSAADEDKIMDVAVFGGVNHGAGNAVEIQSVSAARLNARLDSHETSFSALRDELSKYQSKDDSLMASSQHEERLMQLECNAQRIDDLESQLRDLQAQKRACATPKSGSADTPTSTPDSTVDDTLLSGSKGLRYLRSRDPKPFLEGVGSEISKIRAAIQSKIKQQDETDEGWKIMGHLGEVLWALDKAVDKAKKGVQEL